MNRARSPAERLVWSLGAVLVVALVLSLLGLSASRRASFSGRYASWNAAGDGARAVAVLAERLGRSPQRLTRSLDSPPAGGTLLSIAPRPDASSSLVASLIEPEPFSSEEVDALLTWIADGNTLILLSRDTSELLTRLGVTLETKGLERAPDALGHMAKSDAWPPPLMTASPAQPDHRLTCGVSLLQVEEDTAWATWTQPEATERVELQYTPLLEAEWDGEERDVAAEIVYGRGRLIWAGSPFLASNLGLSKADNGVWIALLLASEPGVLHIDEFHHGFVHRRTLAGYLQASGLWVVLLQLLLLGVLCGWRFSCRFGAPLPTPQPLPAGAGHEALGRIYHEGGHDDHALAVLMAELERVLKRHASHQDDPEITKRLGLLRRRVQASRQEEPLVHVARSIVSWTARLEQRGLDPMDADSGES